MKNLVVAAVLCIVSTITYSQENFLVWSENKPLEWNDFSGQTHDSSNYDAEVFAEVRYRYSFRNLKDFRFDVAANFNKNISWSKKQHQSQDLLKHEQLHFDIAEVYARKMKEVFDNYQYSENFEEEIVQLFNEKKAEYHALQHRYDEETNHSLNKEKQIEWEAYVHHELSRSKPIQQLVSK
jgi:hypothetical protein